jgi:hypothetical protein
MTLMARIRGAAAWRLLGVSLAGTVLVVAVLVAPELTWMLPRIIREHPIEWTAAALVSAYALLRLGLGGRGLVPGFWCSASRILDLVDRSSIMMIRWGLPAVFGGLGLWWLATWLPQYPFWPWCRDEDTFAMLAMSWEVGDLPYRDIRAYNFPGHIYLHWLLGKTLGWGRPAAFYIFDGGLLLLLVGVTIAWSRRCLGHFLPGLISSLIFLGSYLDFHFETVAERDWHATLTVVLAMMLVQGWFSRLAVWLSAFLVAVAFTIRPHVLLFAPALALTLTRRDAAARQAGGSSRPWALVWEWFIAGMLFTTLLWWPLVRSGILGDFVRGLKVAAYGGPYSRASLSQTVKVLVDDLSDPRTLVLLGLLGLLSWLSWRNGRSGSRPRRGGELALCWLLALWASLFYRPLHPVQHFYLVTPLRLLTAIAWAIPSAAILESALGPSRSRLGLLRLGLLRPWPCLIALGLIPGTAIPRFPQSCSLEASVQAVQAALQGSWPDAPPAARIWYDPKRQPFYTWDGYQRLLRYIRVATGPQTIVANVLKNPPFPAVNGPTGRRSPFRAESGITWMWLVNQDLDEEFARDLDRAGPDSVVVWSPTEIGTQPRLELKQVTKVIQRRYALERQFGTVEVWRRAEPAVGNPDSSRNEVCQLPNSPEDRSQSGD